MSDIPRIINAPNIIFLQIGEDYIDGEEVDFDDLDEVTWCANSISDTDLAYVPKERAEKAEAENAALRADAERYRWLREEHNKVDPVGRVVWKKGSSRNTSDWCDLVDGADLDRHVDAAIDAARKP